MDKVLPSGRKFRVLRVQTGWTRCRCLVYEPKKTRLQNYQSEYLFVVIDNDQTIVYGIELLVFKAADSYTLFVSKADTTGFFDSGKDTTQSRLLIKDITIKILESIVSIIPNDKTIKVCLFAKAHPHYLFAGSAGNPKKHVLTDAQLVKWWMKVLDSVGSTMLDIKQAKIQMPGSDTRAIGMFIPKDAKIPCWEIGDVFEGDDRDKAVYCIPRFPDDPKTRFLDYLVLERRTMKTTRREFWLEMESRQEFRLGSVVGIIGLEGSKKHANQEDPLKAIPSKIVSKHQMERLTKSLLDGNFDTLEATIEATRNLMEKIQGTEVIGAQMQNSRRPYRNTDAKPVNVLSTSIVRKKKGI